MAFEQALLAGLVAIDVELSADQVAQTAAHFAGVLRWNKVHNLTRVTEPRAAAERHYVDSFAGFKALEAAGVPGPGRVVDVGSGAGFPGLVGAIFWPEVEFTLLDAAAKRCSFLELVSQQVGLTNVKVMHADARQVSERWPLVVSRATFAAGHLQAALGLRGEQGRAALWVGDDALDPVSGSVGGELTGAEVVKLGSTRVAVL